VLFLALRIEKTEICRLTWRIAVYDRLAAREEPAVRERTDLTTTSTCPLSRTDTQS
jgi:hypothetical protein